MTALGWLLVFAGAGCLLFAIGCQLDAMEIRWERRNRELMERWEANRRGAANVTDFQKWQEREKEKGAA